MDMNETICFVSSCDVDSVFTRDFGSFFSIRLKSMQNHAEDLQNMLFSLFKVDIMFCM